MSISSINTNTGALVALQNLNATNRALETTQNRVNTGLKVATAKDNGAIFAIATNQRADMAALDAVKTSVQRGRSVMDVAMAAGETVVEALKEMKALAISIEDFDPAPAAGSNPSYDAYVADYAALQEEITESLEGASFDGVNLFASPAAKMTIRTGLDVSETQDIGFFDNTGTANWTAPTLAAMTSAGVQTAIESFSSSMATLGTQSKSLDRKLVFLGKLQDSLETGVGNLVDADLAKESAKLSALQTKQQLGVQALSIANQAPQMILSLFKG